MANEISAKYRFLPWVRQGASSNIQTPDSLGPNQPGIATVDVQLKVNGEDVVQKVRLYGPGDVTGIDKQQVVRTEPRHLTTDFEPNYFPAIEFDSPEFPWMFTPAKSNNEDVLRPWLCLVVVRKQPGVRLRSDRTKPFLMLEIADAREELPNLSESWAWAHVQISGSGLDANSLNNSLKGDPALTVSRLLCPRKLEPLTDYLACVVPTFELGVLAGLQKEINGDHEAHLRPAWKPTDREALLPVYYNWEFSTGPAGDFEDLASLIQTRVLPDEVGSRSINFGLPGSQFAHPPLQLQGALRLWNLSSPAWEANSRQVFQSELKQILNAPARALESGTSDPLVAPPIYGEWYAARHTVNLPFESTPSHSWMDELNLDPRHRAAAALGTRVVQAQQEELMASAWKQMGELTSVNQRQRQAQLARAVSGALFSRHFKRLSNESLMKVLAPGRSRVIINDLDEAGAPVKRMLATKISHSPVPAKAVSAPMRRITRARGAINIRFREVVTQTDLVVRMNTTSFVPKQRPEANLVKAESIFAQIPDLSTISSVLHFISTAPPHSQFRVFAEGEPTPKQPGHVLQTDGPAAKEFRAAGSAKEQYVESTFTFTPGPDPNQINFETTRAELLRKVDPEKTIAARVLASRTIRGSAPDREDELEPFLDSPEFNEPMYKGLRDISQDFLFPGLENVPANTVAMLKPNPIFIEAFMVGLNAEMGRELLWRNYPTNQRGTYFNRFWETIREDTDPDISPVHNWSNGLGNNANSSDNLVLLIRADLLRRYPNTVIYAVRARDAGGGQLEIDPDAEEEHPIFRGTLKPDVTFLGFNLTDIAVLEGAGFFFVIQQQPTEPRFGLDVARKFGADLAKPTLWDQLSWGHLVADEAAFKTMTHVSAAKTATLPDTSAISDPAKAEWARNSAHMAYITRQQPVRVLIHAKDLLRKR
jgi:hypothetical protein